MDSLGLFDPELRVECLVDPAFLIEGWFDPEMIGVGVVVPPPIPPPPKPPTAGGRITLGALNPISPSVHLVSVVALSQRGGAIKVQEPRIATDVVRQVKVTLGPVQVKKP